MTYKIIKRIIVFICGISVVLVGLILLVTPGPAFIVIPAGLMILATEFVWAKKILDRFKEKFKEMAENSKKPGAFSNAVQSIKAKFISAIEWLKELRKR